MVKVRKTFMYLVAISAVIGILAASWELWGLFINYHVGCSQ